MWNSSDTKAPTVYTLTLNNEGCMDQDPTHTTEWFLPSFYFYVVTRSYSSHLFLCTLALVQQIVCRLSKELHACANGAYKTTLPLLCGLHVGKRLTHSSQHPPTGRYEANTFLSTPTNTYLHVSTRLTRSYRHPPTRRYEANTFLLPTHTHT